MPLVISILEIDNNIKKNLTERKIKYDEISKKIHLKNLAQMTTVNFLFIAFNDLINENIIMYIIK